MLAFCFNTIDGELSNFKRKKDKTISKPTFKNFWDNLWDFLKRAVERDVDIIAAVSLP